MRGGWILERLCVHDTGATAINRFLRKSTMVTTAAFSMDSPDFVGEIMTYWGARFDSDGTWCLPNGLLVSLYPSQFISRAEHGWHRWQLPGFDGATRGRLVDHNAPFVVCSPDEVWFWCSPRGRHTTRLNVSQLLDKVAKHANDGGTRRGWPVTRTVRAQRGKA